MQDRSSRGLSLKRAIYEGNTSGWEAVDYKIIVQKDDVEEVTAGGIVVPGEAKDMDWWTVTTGVLVSKGHLAFSEGRDKSGELIRWENPPELGDRVMMRENVGHQFEGEDGKKYCMYTDRDVGGVACRPQAQEQAA